MKNGYIRVGCAAPKVRIADCAFNAEQIILAMREAKENELHILVTPELSLTGYTCGDLFMQGVLLDGTVSALESVLKATIGSDMIVVVGLPLCYLNKLYNCAAILQNGKILGVIPKKNLPNYAGSAEVRYFAPAFEGTAEITLCGQDTLFGTDILFACREMRDFVFAAEICEDLWVPCPPSISHTAAGANVILNLSASNDVAGKAAYRRMLVESLSARIICGYVYANAGYGESTTDSVFSGQRMVAENGKMIGYAAPFDERLVVYSELDLSLISSERRNMNTYNSTAAEGYDIVEFSCPMRETPLSRSYAKSPFIPEDKVQRDELCEEILTLQASGLAKRIEHSHAKAAVIGLSGGLDSTLAILVCARALKMLGRDSTDIAAVTMPCFGTTNRTRGNAEILAERVGARLRTIDIAESVKVHFNDIGHADDNYNVVFENAQARERTQILMDVANQENGLVIGTGDLSELALGWATYNGDHMSMYGVNGSVPKTLIRHIVNYEAYKTDDEKLRAVLLDILDTPVSPELLPAKDGEIAQKTEDLVGP
ncbi:MAG: NAD(+) synthase, partial [Oscillospiraceae bacterium]|nr:NAD(+) synthase [Oscillospiraceae bacterium]